MFRMDTEAYRAHQDERLGEISRPLLEKAVTVARRVIAPEHAEMIRQLHAEHGPYDWIHHWGPHGGQHFGWGMWMRNQLRMDGLIDDQLPIPNWDDYYLPVVEIALGLREMPGGGGDS